MSTDSSMMPNNSYDEYSGLRQQIDNSLQRAEAQRNNLKKIDRRYSIFNIILGAIATFIAGQSVVSDQAPMGTWRNMTTISSLFALGATVASGLHKQLASPDLLAEASQCVAKLKALKVETVASTFELEKVCEAYQQILTEFSKIDC
ncbi:hypothetical protein OsccyDRAFT_0122 [Leptolyngbyaceae cyanobacterium JSC-12]|nr:hypothetical protein OsccyDRAFT_0122 [Leptolyngbyaceae cyanobacterium JSC-12]